jgi:sulfatase maturation enzyme AslB (radical SAM superfamily)
MNKYVVTTPSCHYNTVLKKKLPLDASENELKTNLFLEGQEEECLFRSLYGAPIFCNFEIIPTWECNLRCTHCSVLHQLKPKDHNSLNIDKLIEFVQRYVKEYQSTLHKINFSFVGGEPLLRAQSMNDFLDRLIVPVDITARITTNAVCDLKDVELALLAKMSQITVSIDGNHEQHNLQRKVYLKNIDDPYHKTIANLQILLKKFGKNVHVQASVRDEFYTYEHKKSFYETMLRHGVYKDNIVYGCIHPTEKKPEPQKTYLKSLQLVKLRNNPCCKFRYMKNLVIDSSNAVFSEFFSVNSNNQLGTLDGDFDVIQQKHRDIIKNTMPVLKDAKCMECPVIGYCWGSSFR